MSYPDGPGYVRNNQSSEEAADSMRESAASIRYRVHEYIASQPQGVTCDEAEVALNLSHQTCSARCTELKRQGKVSAQEQMDGTKIRRPTRSGRNADVLFSRVPPVKPSPGGLD